jgi:hypothetical protein
MQAALHRTVTDSTGIVGSFAQVRTGRVTSSTMDQSSEKGTPPKRESIFSLRRSFSSAANGQPSPVVSEGIASPDSNSLGNRRSSAPAMVPGDENASDAGGTESGATPQKKKSKIFSTKFVKKMFRSNSMSSATGGDENVPFDLPDGDEGEQGAFDGADEIDDRQSEASAMDGVTEDGTTPKKKKSKIFSTKFVKKMFRSNSLSSTGAPDTPGSQEGGEASPAPPADDSASKPKRKSIFSIGRSSFSGADGKTSAPPSVASPVVPEGRKPAANSAYQGPVSPTFDVKNKSGDDVDEDEDEGPVTKVDTSFRTKQSFFDSPATAGAPPAKSPDASNSPGSAKLLFGSVEDVPAINSPPQKLEYDLPMHSPAREETWAGTGAPEAKVEYFVALSDTSSPAEQHPAKGSPPATRQKVITPFY